MSHISRHVQASLVKWSTNSQHTQYPRSCVIILWIQTSYRYDVGTSYQHVGMMCYKHHVGMMLVWCSPIKLSNIIPAAASWLVLSIQTSWQLDRYQYQHLDNTTSGINTKISSTWIQTSWQLDRYQYKHLDNTTTTTNPPMSANKETQNERDWDHFANTLKAAKALTVLRCCALQAHCTRRRLWFRVLTLVIVRGVTTVKC